MSDFDLISAALSMLDTAAVVSRRGKIIYMNPVAIGLAGVDLTSKPLDMLMPSHIANNQADSFVTSAFIGSRSCTVKVTSANGYRIYVINCADRLPEPSDSVFDTLRSCMSNIKFSASCISVIAEDVANDKLTEYVCTLNRNYYRIKRALDNLGTLSGIERGSLPFCPEPVDMTELFGNIVDTVNILTQKQDISISFSAEDHLRIVADRELIVQMMLNLLSNSIASCDRGGRIAVSLLRTDKNLIVCVDDNGSGIPTEELGIVFDKYKQHGSLSSPTGSGIGLAVAKSIAELHHGTLIIESRGEGQGTSVRVMLSYDIPSGKKLSAPENEYEYNNSVMQLILTELSGCLTLNCYSEFLED